MISSSFLRTSFLLIVLAMFVLIFTTCTDYRMPEEVDYEHIEQSASVGTGVTYSLHQNVSTQELQKSINNFVGWIRYPAEEREWLYMTDATAYYRDVMVGGQTTVTQAEDGEEWTAFAILPNGNTADCGWVRYYDEYNGYYHCFVFSSGQILTVVGPYILYIYWFVESQNEEIPGEWTMTFKNDGQLIHEGAFKVLPQIPPGKVPIGADYNQLSYGDLYANTQRTIANLGCYLTSCCMVLGYHGVTVTPPVLNAWLNSNNGYQGALVDPAAVVRYAQGLGTEVYFVGRAESNILPNYICSRGPHLAHVRRFGRNQYHHFVTVIGENEERTTFKINDPTGGVERLLSDRYQDIGSLRVFEGPEYEYRNDQSGIRIVFHSPGELLITNPQGLKLGFDPLTNQSYNEIPNGWYEEVYIEDPLTEGDGIESRVLHIMRPTIGDYNLTIIGTGEGTYDLSVRTYDIMGGTSTIEFYDIEIITDVVHSYLVQFNNATGSQVQVGGGFDGGGQRPRDVNKFLTYGNISSNRTELPGGTTNFGLQVVYGETIIASSFESTADGADISDLFSPAPANCEVVNIPLHSGRNVIILSVDGNLPNRVANDKDRLVFIVSP